jgi:hypothetical protein
MILFAYSYNLVFLFLQSIYLYSGKAIQGKRCKRITDVLEEKYNSLHFVPEETFTEQVQRAPRQNSPSQTLGALRLAVGDYNRDTGMYGMMFNYHMVLTMKV